MIIIKISAYSIVYIIDNRKDLMNLLCRSKLAGITISAFGLGILLAFFLPEYILVVIEATVIIAAGCFFIKA